MAAEKSSQVRIQLTSSQPDIALPEKTGPILVNTCRLICFLQMKEETID